MKKYLLSLFKNKKKHKNDFNTFHGSVNKIKSDISNKVGNGKILSISICQDFQSYGNSEKFIAVAVWTKSND